MEQRRQYRRNYVKSKAYADHYYEIDKIRKDARSHGCSTCAESDPRCIDLHHRDPKTKKFKLTAKNMGRSAKAWIEEIAKCTPLCANCHRKLDHDALGD